MKLIRYLLSALFCACTVMAGVTGLYHAVFAQRESDEICVFADGDAGRAIGEENRVALLARLLYAELPEGTYLDRISLAATVLNRVESASYPDTLSGVIGQSGVFASVADGRYYAPIDVRDEAYLQCVSASELAVCGMDPTDGATAVSPFFD